MEQAGLSFVVKKEPVAEDFPVDLDLRKVPVFLAEKKAEALQSTGQSETLILAADTVVLLDNKIMDKPANRNEAYKTLTALSGRMHEVLTGVCLLKGKKKKSFSVCTKVFFRELSSAQITYYIDVYQPLDKAGAYAIQEWIGLIGVERIEGDYFNVVGLPVGRLVEEISGF